ncbi:hypothetical protein K431DRAFT_283413 [Polychaeton citri CBS 116435]|uniref:Uncharacterized protein n=1 Tax=Polychaeton citri CBS 116435 TaxID=1314669 RepID=A0A9P4QDE6_9PEZI|nr:hypothetical protein K431DRAFT_283413 [Polychaeton citri CBS 116435]
MQMKHVTSKPFLISTSLTLPAPLPCHFANTLAFTLSTLVWAYFGAKKMNVYDLLLTAPSYCWSSCFCSGWSGPSILVYMMSSSFILLL